MCRWRGCRLCHVSMKRWLSVHCRLPAMSMKRWLLAWFVTWLQLFELQNKQQAVRLCWSWLCGPGLHWHASAAMLSLGLLSADCSRVVADRGGMGLVCARFSGQNLPMTQVLRSQKLTAALDKRFRPQRGKKNTGDNHCNAAVANQCGQVCKISGCD